MFKITFCFVKLRSWWRNENAFSNSFYEWLRQSNQLRKVHDFEMNMERETREIPE